MYKYEINRFVPRKEPISPMTTSTTETRADTEAPFISLADLSARPGWTIHAVRTFVEPIPEPVRPHRYRRSDVEAFESTERWEQWLRAWRIKHPTASEARYVTVPYGAIDVRVYAVRHGAHWVGTERKWLATGHVADALERLVAEYDAVGEKQRGRVVVPVEKPRHSNRAPARS